MTSGTAPIRPRVLVVDDRPDGRRALRAVLEPLGHGLVEASFGREALRRLPDHEFAVVVINVYPPARQGLETARLIKGREPTGAIPILLVSAGADDRAQRLEGYRLGVADVLPQPFEPEVLRAKVAVFAALWARTALIERRCEELAVRSDELERGNARLVRRAAEMERTNAALERSNAALERFAGGAGHELREPLHTVAGLLDLLSDRHGAGMNEEARLLVERASAATGSARRMIGTLLEDACARPGEIHREPVPLGDALAEAQRELAAELKAAGASIHAGPLPTVPGDRSQLVRLFVNLIDNSLRYRSETPPEIRVWGGPAEGGWRVAVSDNGSGVAASDLPRLFTVWGSGLGLAVCRRIVERHGGSIWAEPAEGGGTTVCIDLAGP